MADGTSKPIEQIVPGDMVLAVDHNDPEHDTPKPAKVTRFFDNGLKNVVKLIFENQKTKEQFEVTCTPTHRFYTKNKGWICAESLQSGEQCISADKTEITFLSRKELQDQHHVYNFEVEEKHTYYVGHGEIFVLVHNSCWGTIQVIGAGIGGFFTGAGHGAVNIITGTAKAIGEMGCQAIDVGGGIITAGSMLFSDNPIVFNPWSNSLQALDQQSISTEGYYGNFATNVFTFGVYSEVQTGIQWWNGDISDDEASEIFGSTGVMQIISARVIKNPTQIQTPKTFIDQISPSEAMRYRAYWHDAKLKQYLGVRSWAREQVSNDGKYTYKAFSYFDEFGRLRAEEHFSVHTSTGLLHPNPHYHLYNPITGQKYSLMPGKYLGE